MHILRGLGGKLRRHKRRRLALYACVLVIDGCQKPLFNTEGQTNHERGEADIMEYLAMPLHSADKDIKAG